MPLAKIVEHCSTLKIFDAHSQSNCVSTPRAVHYHARFRERSMKQAGVVIKISRKGAKAQSKKEWNHEGTKDTKSFEQGCKQHQLLLSSL